MIRDRLQVQRADHVRCFWEAEVHADHASSIRVHEPRLGFFLELDHLLADLSAQLTVPVEVLRHPAFESFDRLRWQSPIFVVRVVDHNNITPKPQNPAQMKFVYNSFINLKCLIIYNYFNFTHF